MDVVVKGMVLTALLALQASTGSVTAGDFRNEPAERTDRLQRSAGLPQQPATGAGEDVHELHLPPGMQSFVFDEARNDTFVLHVEKQNGREHSSISRFRTVPGIRQQPVDSAEAVPFLGHQGLGLEQGKGGASRLWASVRHDPYKAVRFRYDRGQISDVQFYKLFPDSFFDKNETLPAVCEGQQYLAVRGRRSGNRMVIRLFDLQQLATRGPGDYTEAFAYEWDVDPSITRPIDGAFQAVQSLACDGKHVYVLAGSSSSKTGKRIHVYTWNGAMVKKNEDITIGMSSARSDPGGYFYEPEGLAFRRVGNVPIMFMGVVSGPGRKHINRLWPVELE